MELGLPFDESLAPENLAGRAAGDVVSISVSIDRGSLANVPGITSR